MRNKVYKERKQPKDRLKYGKLEKKKELVKRLAKINKQRDDINKAKEEIRNKTGQEYFFGYYSVKKDNGCVYRTEDSSIDELKKMKVYIDSEIHRSEKKIEKCIPRPTNVHIKFESDNEANEDLFDFEKNEKMRQEFVEYINQLKEKRKEVLDRINDLLSR